jgi:hypothetical protein
MAPAAPARRRRERALVRTMRRHRAIGLVERRYIRVLVVGNIYTSNVSYRLIADQMEDKGQAKRRAS